MMNRRLARRNMRMGITLFVVICAMLGVTFLWAIIYLHAITPSS